MHCEEVTALRDFFITQLLKIEGVVLNGPSSLRVANNVNISIEGIDAEFAVIVLNEKGIACATKSACGASTGAGSSVVKAISHDPARALSSLRFSLGLQTTKEEIISVALALEAHVSHTRKTLQNLTA
jgi:cysteine desulfurase